MCGGSEGGLSPLFYNGYVGHTRHAVLSRFLGIRFRFALWLSPGRGEELPPSRDDGAAAYKRRITAPNSVPADTKRLRKTTVLRSLCFCCKKQEIATAGWVPVATRGCIATAGWVPVATDRCIATVGWVLVATAGCIATVGCVRQRKEGMVKPSLLIFNQRFRAGECGYVCGFAPRNPAPGRAPQGG